MGKDKDRAATVVRWGGRGRSLTLRSLLAVAAATVGLATVAVTVPASAASGKKGLTVAKVRTKKAEAVPKFMAHATLPTSKVKALAGGTIWFVSEGQTIPYFATVYQGIQQGAAAAGMTAKVYDAHGSPTGYNQGVQTAITQKAAGIVLGFPPTTLQPSIGAQAKAAGIPITDAGVVDLKDPMVTGEVGHVAWSYGKSGASQADWVVAHSKGKATVLTILSSGYKVQDYRLSGFTKELKSLCSACSMAGTQHVPFTQWTSQLPTIVTTAVTKNPKINYILVGDDAMVLYVQQGLQRVPGSKVAVVSSDASEYNLGLVKAGKTELADAGEPENWIGWATVDVILRSLTAGVDANEAVPLRLFTQTNLPANYKNVKAVFPVNWQADFKKEWGLG